MEKEQSHKTEPGTDERKKQRDDVADVIARQPLDTVFSKLRLVLMLTWPAILAQMSMVVMEYIDAAMVGSLGAVAAAGIGLVSTTTWLFWGLGIAVGTGYAVQVAHQIGADDNTAARQTLRQSVVVIGAVGIVLDVIGIAIADGLPRWLGGNSEVCAQATGYFRLFIASLPFMMLSYLASSMLRSAGNMVLPGLMNVAMCVLDVVFNFFLIYETRDVTVLGTQFRIWGAGLGVQGAALGSAAAFCVGGMYMWWWIVKRSRRLSHAFSHKYCRHWYSLRSTTVRRAASISWPIAVERTVMCGAQILITAIVAPLGTAAIAANSFAITAESLCYTPGYGVGDAATTLVGQSLGAGRRELARSFGRIAIAMGMGVMTALGVVMWLLAPEMMALFTPDVDVQSLGVMALRTEAWAEPMFGAAIVTYCVFIGAGYTKVPATVNFSSMWLVRLTLSALLATEYGLFGVWLAMAIELSVRGLAFLCLFRWSRWLTRGRRDENVPDELAHDPSAADTPDVL
ncbi:MAG: MATE family efflux transporter [Muribaculaceae bacterium]|nr:MATE family efflux transporter [Muribaculaceae bacterium]